MWQQESYMNVAAERSGLGGVMISGGRVDTPAGAYVVWRKDGVWDTQCVLDAGDEFPSPQYARALGRPAFDGSTVAHAIGVDDRVALARRHAMAFFDLPMK